jgi:AcrR family transcriptional regulator
MPAKREDWFKAGLGLLVSRGAARLTVDAMCQVLGLTKGSFYHHFENLQDFKDQLLAYWQEVDTQAVVQAASRLNGGDFCLDGLIQVLGSRSAESANPELAIRAWAMQDKTVHAAVAKIDTARIAMTRQLLQRIAGDAERAQLLSRMLYALLIGSYSIIPPIEKEEVRQIYQEFKILVQ